MGVAEGGDSDGAEEDGFVGATKNGSQQVSLPTPSFLVCERNTPHSPLHTPDYPAGCCTGIGRAFHGAIMGRFTGFAIRHI